MGVVLVLAGSVFAGDWVKEWREARRPLPPADSPNVLLIVLDTVRADHLSLYGYHRATTPKLERVGEAGHPLRRGARDRALDPRLAREPVHRPLAPRARRAMDDAAAREVPDAGRVPGVSWLCDRGFRRQYRSICSYDTGMDRGFTHYEDYVLGPLAAVRTAFLVELAFKDVLGLAANYGRSF